LTPKYPSKKVYKMCMLWHAQYRNIYYYIMTLYECDSCYLVQDFYSLSKLLGGGRGGGLDPLAPHP
jgi:hypothetical protein